MKQLANVRKAVAGVDDATLTRWIKEPTRHTSERKTTPMPANAVGTRFKTRVLAVNQMSQLLVSGHSNIKIGRDVRKGKLKGYWIYTLSLEERATCPSSCAHWTDCFDPETPVLRGDLSWASASSLQIGDRVAAFEEQGAASGHRKTLVTTVEAVETFVRPRLRVTTDKGVLVTSTGHLWLTKRDRKGYQWRRADELRVGDNAPFFQKPWATATSYDAARLRGFVEGEGHCVLNNNQGFKRNSTGWGQRPGKLVDEINAIARDLGFTVSRYERVSGVNKSNVSLMEIAGGWRETTRFIGSLRPTRMIEKAEALWADQWLAGRDGGPAKILSVEKLEDAPVTAIRTASSTLVASGFFTHNCYGNSMPFAKRIDHRDPAFLPTLEAEIEKLLNTRGRVGVLIRLHALGDFYSTDYVNFWWQMLAKHERLAIYGYTAHCTATSVIGVDIEAMNSRYSERCMVRQSDGGRPGMSTLSITDPTVRVPDAFVCPEQTGKTQCCATCALCWGTAKNVCFIGH